MGDRSHLLRYLLEEMRLPLPDPCDLESFMDVVSDELQESTVILMDEIGVALQRYPQEEVASLTGSAWLEFLDATGGDGEFRNGAGQVLETGPYRQHVQNVAVDSLLALARSWGLKNLEARPWR